MSRPALDTFTQAYIEAALWSSTTDDDTPMDRDHGPDDLAPETLALMVADCAKFQADHGTPEYNDRRYSDDEKAGHDFWLTRNGHGAGFWDRDLPDDIGKRYTDAAKAFGSFDLYVGDDGAIHGS